MSFVHVLIEFNLINFIKKSKRLKIFVILFIYLLLTVFTQSKIPKKSIKIFINKSL
jgi:hypothetical protein